MQNEVFILDSNIWRPLIRIRILYNITSSLHHLTLHHYSPSMFISFARLPQKRDKRQKRTKPACRFTCRLPAEGMEGMAGREKDGLGFRRPTNGSIPKPDKPFVPAFQ